MRHLIDHFLIKLAILMLGVLIVSKVAEVVIGLIWSALARINASWLGELLVFLTTVTLIVGLGVRGVRAVTSHGASRGREQAARARQSRQAVRRPAQDVPVMAERAIPVDRDPTLDDGED